MVMRCSCSMGDGNDGIQIMISLAIQFDRLVGFAHGTLVSIGILKEYVIVLVIV